MYIRGCSEFVLLYYCIIVLTCILHLPCCLQWVLVIVILRTSLSARVDFISSCFVLLTCIELYYCIILCLCIYPSVYSEYRFLSSPHPHVCLCLDLFSLARRTIYLSIDIVYYYLPLCIMLCNLAHWSLLLVICLLPQLLRAVAPALTLITSSKLRQTFCLLFWTFLLIDWLTAWCLWCSLCCPVPYFYFRFLNYFPIYYFMWHFKLINLIN